MALVAISPRSTHPAVHPTAILTMSDGDLATSDADLLQRLINNNNNNNSNAWTIY